MGTELSNTLLTGSPADAKAAVRIAAELEEVQSFLRTIVRRNDAFAGYSLAESLQERINRIGVRVEPDAGGTAVDPDTSPGVTYGGQLTLLAKLAFLEKKLLGEKGDDGLIAAAKEFRVTTDVTAHTIDKASGLS